LLGILGLFGDHSPSKHGPEFDKNQLYQTWAGIVLGAVTLWLWLNAFFRLARTPMIDALLATLVPLCVTIQIQLTNRLDNFQYSGDDGWFLEPMILVSNFLFTLFSMGFAFILCQRYFVKPPAENR